MKIVITGSDGLLGRHTAVRAHAANCAARFKGADAPYDVVLLNRATFQDNSSLYSAISDADAVIHYAGVNRAPDEVIETENPAIAERLARACRITQSNPHVVYANSTHATGGSPYGRSKRLAGEILSKVSVRFTDLVLPHIFGEGARPRYNNVTGTFIDAVIAEETPEINPEGRVSLLHAGAAAQVALNAVTQGQTGTLQPVSREIAVSELFELLRRFHADYRANIYPDLRDPFTVALFNSYRAALYPDEVSRPLRVNVDARGSLFEAVKGGGGQTFLSTTMPGVTRGDHFHLNKVERFLVVQGEAVIRIRKVLSDKIWEYRVSGATPVAVDIPTLHTHSIENVGGSELLTLFWTNELFDPVNPDTFADKVLK